MAALAPITTDLCQDQERPGKRPHVVCRQVVGKFKIVVQKLKEQGK